MNKNQMNAIKIISDHILEIYPALVDTIVRQIPLICLVEFAFLWVVI